MKKYVFSVLILIGSLNATFANACENCAKAAPKDANVTIEEFGDFQCPYCAKGAQTMNQIEKDYHGRVHVIFRNAPLPIHAHAEAAAKAFTAVNLQSPELGNSYREELFKHQDRLKEGESYLYEAAKKVGADVAKMKTDMNGDTVAHALAEDKAAWEKRGFTGTPSFVIGSQTLVGAYPYAEFKNIIEAELGR